MSDYRNTKKALSDATTLLQGLIFQKPVAAEDEAQASHRELIDVAVKSFGSLREQLEYAGKDVVVHPAGGGHMAYKHMLVGSSSQPRPTVFIKQHDPTQFDDPIREAHSRTYLEKEHAVYQHLSHHNFSHIPEQFELIGNQALLLPALSLEAGWQWRMPSNDAHRQNYIRQIIAALTDLQKIPIDDQSLLRDSHAIFLREGWRDFTALRSQIEKRLLEIPGSELLLSNLEDYAADVDRLDSLVPNVTTHHDLRQSNIAWHPDEGVRIVDWSWSAAGLPNADSTSFIIDLAKAGHDVSGLLEYFNPDHAKILIGFWLAHSTRPANTQNDSVRTQQAVSAIHADRILSHYFARGSGVY